MSEAYLNYQPGPEDTDTNSWKFYGACTSTDASVFHPLSRISTLSIYPADQQAIADEASEVLNDKFKILNDDDSMNEVEVARLNRDIRRENRRREQVAKAICAQCFVWRDCLAAALQNDESGVWGGLNERERRKLSKQF